MDIETKPHGHKLVRPAFDNLFYSMALGCTIRSSKKLLGRDKPPQYRWRASSKPNTQNGFSAQELTLHEFLVHSQQD